MISKEYKIMVAVAPTVEAQDRLMARIAVRYGFARIPSDAMKIITRDVYGIDLSTAYFVMASGYNFRGGTITNQRLFELAARGLFVLVGCKRIPREYEFICKAFFETDL